jgi:hypothetical protein
MSDRLIYGVTCERWERGLILHVDGVGVTQTHEDYPDTAEDVARSYISLMLDVPEDSFDVAITPPETTAAIEAAYRRAQAGETVDRGDLPSTSTRTTTGGVSVRQPSGLDGSVVGSWSDSPKTTDNRPRAGEPSGAKWVVRSWRRPRT